MTIEQNEYRKEQQLYDNLRKRFFGALWDSSNRENNKNVDLNLARRVAKVISRGLVDGVGTPKAGQMCVEAAVCYALGQDHGDDPHCVGTDVASAKIHLNDCGLWKSKKERARLLMRVGIAQLGSVKLDQNEFNSRYNNKRVAIRKMFLLKDLHERVAKANEADNRYMRFAGTKIETEVMEKFLASKMTEEDARVLMNSGNVMWYGGDGEIVNDCFIRLSTDHTPTSRDELISFIDALLETLVDMQSPGVALLHEMEARGELPTV